MESIPKQVLGGSESLSYVEEYCVASDSEMDERSEDWLKGKIDNKFASNDKSASLAEPDGFVQKVLNFAI